MATLRTLVRTVSAVALATALSAPLAGAQPAPTAASLGAVRGTVFDSLAGAPLAGASVQIAPVGDTGPVRSATTDPAGRFQFDSLPAGRWMLVVYDPFSEALFGDPRPVAFVVQAGAPVSVALATPGASTLRASLCPGRAPGDSTGAIVGFVRDADADRFVDSAAVSITWSELEIARGIRVVQRQVPTKVSAAGVYLFCGVPTDADLVVRASAPAMASGDFPIAVRPGAVVRRDVALGRATLDSAGRARGGARLVGVVHDDRDRPLVHAHVVVFGAASTASTDDAGAFRLDSLPSGTWTVEARAIGFEPARTTASLAQARPAEVRLRMAKRAAVLDQVVVRGRASRSTSRLAELLKRQRSTSGTFLTPADIEKRNPLYPSDLLRTVAGMRVVPDPRGGGSRLLGRGNCTPAVYLDGMPVYEGANDIDQIVSARDIMAVEVYRGIETPAEFSMDRDSGCGAVVVWTKR